jgi:hypothetical protein
MNTKLIWAALLTAAVAVPASAGDTTPATSNNVCLQRHLIDGWGARDAHSMVIDDHFGRKYLLTLGGLCNDLDFSFGVGIRGFGGGSMCVERGDHIMMRGGGVSFHNDTCWVTKVQVYTPEMAAADKAARAAHQPLATY